MATEPRTLTVRTGPGECTACSGPMPPIKPTGRIPIYCSGACRKAAYEARRLRKSDAFAVKVVETKGARRSTQQKCVQTTCWHRRGRFAGP